mgnify:CR=1 FL=1
MCIPALLPLEHSLFALLVLLRGLLLLLLALLRRVPQAQEAPRRLLLLLLALLRRVPQAQEAPRRRKEVLLREGLLAGGGLLLAVVLGLAMRSDLRGSRCLRSL